jgi:biopolymer transport protein ExbD
MPVILYIFICVIILLSTCKSIMKPRNVMLPRQPEKKKKKKKKKKNIILKKKKEKF